LKHCRSLLFLPATSQHLLAKATERGADALVIDLEDSVAPERKAEARAMARAAVQTLSSQGATVVLRVNSDAHVWQQDLDRMPLQQVAAVMLPKVETWEQIDAMACALKAMGGESAPAIAALLESPRGVLAARDLAAHPALCALGFGAEDYAANLGVPASPAALSWPAHQVLTCAHAKHLQCWGLAASITEVEDQASFERSVLAARAMGFTGSMCIHPRQVLVVNRGFSPTLEERDWAARVVAADGAARAAGLGVVLLDGRMVDKPIVDRARRCLAAPSS
jgi:citrate lyase subunit beta/citryl-CoA lyase